MQQILKAFFEGKLLEGVHSFSHNSAYHQAFEAVVKAENALAALMGEEQAQQYEETLKLRADMADIAETSYFCYGFRLGMLITAEVLLSRDELLQGAPVL